MLFAALAMYRYGRPNLELAARVRLRTEESQSSTASSAHTHSARSVSPVHGTWMDWIYGLGDIPLILQLWAKPEAWITPAGPR